MIELIAHMALFNTFPRALKEGGGGGVSIFLKEK